MDIHIMDDLISYKKSVALMVALQLNMFEVINEHEFIDETICTQLGLNFNYCKLLFQYFTGEGYLEYNNDSWFLSDSLKKQLNILKEFQTIAQHETNLIKKWMMPENVVSVLKSKTGYREFDLKGFNEFEKGAYNKAVYGNSLKVIGFKITRKFLKDRQVNVLEYGRSNGALNKLITKLCKKVTIYNELQLDKKLDNTYDSIICMNTIHYYKEDVLSEVFNDCYAKLNIGGFLCIADMFYSDDDNFNATLLLDWLTHGGIYNVNVDSIIKLLDKCGFENIEYEFLENISTYIIFAYKFK